MSTLNLQFLVDGSALLIPTGAFYRNPSEEPIVLNFHQLSNGQFSSSIEGGHPGNNNLDAKCYNLTVQLHWDINISVNLYTDKGELKVTHNFGKVKNTYSKSAGADISRYLATIDLAKLAITTTPCSGSGSVLQVAGSSAPMKWEDWIIPVVGVVVALLLVYFLFIHK